ncbi:MAG TPA: alkaline phosphatase PafA [Chitinophagaceae bacterium]|nr:alkaline phosphatase PafA [Chitinophagaceae bacterium]
MCKKYFLLISVVFLAYFSFSQTQNKTTIARPKLVIGLVVDQMRWDFLYRYYDLYSTNGFKRLLSQGFSCENTMIPYVPTYTAPGHTSIYTGSVPAIHGIAGNNWYEKNINKLVYCTDDSTVSGVGSNSIAGKMSPRNLFTTTIADELRLSNNFKSKVIGIALKDRGAILPAGHTANAAYWFDPKGGKWITSSYYMNALPEWLNKFNDKRLPDSYMSKDWNTLLPISKYDLSTNDDKDYERAIGSEKSVTFPHKLPQITTAKYDAFEYTPFANTYTFDFAKAAIENEKLGNNNITDFLALSISGTDYIGHSFGPNSVETQDAYLRLDNDIAEFLKYLDTKIGKNNYLLFLSADHGVAHVPSFLKEHNTPAEVYSSSALATGINELVEFKFNIKNVVQVVVNYQVYLNTIKIEKENKSSEEIKQAVIKYLKEKPFVIDAFETSKIAQTSVPEPIKSMLINGYNTKRSGDIEFLARPQYFDWTPKGTSHGSWNPYDAHIPLVWFGWNIKQGKTNRETYMTDIAPTIAAMLRIQMPNGSIGKVIEEVMK